ncbi:MAG TPA: SIMPL domain-containing protein [Chitinophagales bacterium]|jgi:hypothetical protein|nr:SIMPL domain-containing protein [Chitinophagales bacterium]HPA36620.1 SIMPL domain-containing protein [Chitinophagales bacterium]HQD12256.1 SIMPL domain-containing protein [Chitinophagales bacterium]HQO31789.1 SIMPL domain-containing protein [Chitinophagales bacterium]HQO90423.1 SIMPL domain-containing protein [Chitinophagales bacterium]
MTTDNRLWVALIAGVAFITGTFLLGNAYKYKFRQQQTVLVTGLAETNFESDLIVWDGSYNRQSFDMKSAYAQLKDDEKKIRTFLQSMGINDKEIAFSSVIINKDYVSETNERGGYTQRFNGYNLIQNVRIESSEVAKVESVYKDIAQLIDQGIELNSSAPRYYYSKLKDVKIDLLAKASSDAKLRAETIAKNSDAGLGKLVKSTMGIFQITGKNSDEDYSYGGSFNTSSKIKTASITVRSEYQLK